MVLLYENVFQIRITFSVFLKTSNNVQILLNKQNQG